MNLLYIVESAATGVGRHLIDLIDGALAAGHRIDVVYSPIREDDLFRQGRERLSRMGVRFAAVPMRRAPGAWDMAPLLAIRRHVRRFGPFDVIHGHSSKGGMMARLAGLGSGARVIYTPHAISTLDPTLPRLKRIVYHAGEWVLALASDMIVAVSTEEQRHIVGLGIPARKVKAVLNAIDPPEITDRDTMRRLLGLDEQALAVGFVGRLSRHKAIDVMIGSFAAAWKSDPKLRLIVIGDGDLAATARAEASASGCAPAVSWLGARDARAYYPAFDVLAQPSRFEGLSYALLEAAGAGVPVIATDVGGTRDVIEDGVNGLVMPEIGDAAAFARGLRQATAPETLARLTAAARKRVERGGVARMVNETLALYRPDGRSARPGRGEI